MAPLHLALPLSGIAILMVCSAIAVWKLFDRAELHDEDVTSLSFLSKSVSRLIGNEMHPSELVDHFN